jgi:aspartyl-tRNA(Asn)/glutamyl-tRNA(Gln) amidotransferase subunit B
MPVLNGGAVELAVKAALALGCRINSGSIFVRKNYFYPDLPKGYQITQYEQPLASGGALEIEVGGESRSIGLARLHLEEDAGKSIHEGMPDSDRSSYIDFNRAGVPLIEIVSHPELASSEEAYLFLERLRSVLRYTRVCDGNLEEGSLRCDANISIRGGERVELKNLNSFRNVRRALDYEIQRQSAVAASGGKVSRQTVLWDAAAGESRPIRGKEEEQDYRYFPEPDLPPLIIDERRVARLRDGLPALPAARKRRLREQHALPDHEAHQLTLEAPMADYYEEVVRLSGNSRSAANFILNDLMREQKAGKREADDIPLPAASLAELIALVDNGTISASAARRELFEDLYREGGRPEELVRDRGLEQVDDEILLQELVDKVLEANAEQLERYRAGKSAVFEFFVGRIMEASRGKANPARVRVILEGRLKG